MDGWAVWSGRDVAPGLVGWRLNRVESRGATFFATCGIGRMAGCCRGNARGADGVAVEPGRVAGLKVGREAGVAFGCVREGAARGVNWRCGCGVGLTICRGGDTERCGAARGATWRGAI